MAGRLEVAVLGPVRAWVDGWPVPLGTARQRAVFAALVVAGGRTVAVSELIGAVWGESPPATARHNLHTYVWELRRRLGSDRIESGLAGYRLRLDDDARDSDRFVALTTMSDDPASATDALRLWRGEAYADLEGELFEVERARLTKMRLDAAERHARRLVERGDDGVIAELSTLVREHPLHEPLHELLIKALRAAGRMIEAEAAFRAACNLLAAELGVEPGPGLVALHGLADEPVPDELLQVAALLGPHIPAEALIMATGLAPLAAVASVDRVLADGILCDTGTGLAFRDPARARAVCDGMPRADRRRRRRRLAELLADLGRPAAEVAAQLTAEPLEVDGWIAAWAADHLAEVGEHAPRRTVRLGRLVLGSTVVTERQRAALLVPYVRAEFRLGGHPERAAQQALALVAEPAQRAEMWHVLASLGARDGESEKAAALLASVLADSGMPVVWRGRHRTLLAQLGRAGEPYDAVAALQAQWRTSSVRRDHATALRCADQALALLGRHEPDVALRLDLLDNRIFSLQNLDRLAEAEQSLQDATRLGRRHRLVAPLAPTAAVQRFWTGRWADAIAGISALTDDDPGVDFFGRREQRAGGLLVHGVAALIAARQGRADRTAAYLTASACTESERENGDFLLAARASLAEQAGRAHDGVRILEPLLEPSCPPMMLRHQWLPDLVRLALRADRPDVAERAAELCAAEAAHERTPGRARAAEACCRAVLSGDPGPALSAAEHYRATGRVVERAAALADAAVLLRDRDAAGHCRGEAAAIYRGLGAGWDLRRLDEGFL